MHCKCGYSTKQIDAAVLKETISEKPAIDVVEKEIEPHPLTIAECPKCHHRKAYFWTVQTRASDEPETKFMKCEKCEHVWRDYS
jgi:DNA-directed RNA polymerase subunit M